MATNAGPCPICDEDVPNIRRHLRMEHRLGNAEMREQVRAQNADARKIVPELEPVEEEPAEQFVIATRYTSPKGKVIKHVYGSYPTRAKAKTVGDKMLNDDLTEEERARTEVSYHKLIVDEPKIKGE